MTQNADTDHTKRRKHPPPPIIDVDPFVGIQSVGIAVSKSPRTIRRDLKKGEFPNPIRMGGKLVWRLSTIRNWMAELEASQTHEPQN